MAIRSAQRLRPVALGKCGPLREDRISVLQRLPVRSSALSAASCQDLQLSRYVSNC
jgi:hypothetical protein